MDQKVDPESGYACFFKQRPETVWSLVEWSCGDILELTSMSDIPPRPRMMILKLHQFLPLGDFTQTWRCFPARVCSLEKALNHMAIKLKYKFKLSILDKEILHMLILQIGRLVAYFGFGYDDYATAIWKRVVHWDREYHFRLPLVDREKYYSFWRMLHFAVPGCDCYQCAYIVHEAVLVQ